MTRVSGERSRKLWMIEITALVFAVLLHCVLAREAIFMLVPHRQPEKPVFIFLGSILPIALSGENASDDNQLNGGNIRHVFFQAENRFPDSQPGDPDFRSTGYAVQGKDEKFFLKTTFLPSEKDVEISTDDVVESLGRLPLQYKPLNFNTSP